MLRHLYIIIFFVLFQFKSAAGQTPWLVPDDKKNKLSQVEFNDSIRKHGSELYDANCKLCHGMPGIGNYQKTIPEPPDPASDQMQKNTDGELFFKIYEGRTPMPAFKDVLSSDDLWAVIAYLRKNNKEYLQKIERVIEKTGYNGIVKILLSSIDNKKKIQAKIIGINAQVTEPLKNVEVKLFAQRRFGNIQIDETKSTNESGVVSFEIPENLPGDSAGLVNVIAMLSDQELFGKVKADTLFAIGIPTDLPGLNEKRAIWNTMSKAPIWLLITFFGGVLAAWSTIFYILFQLRKIYFIGKQ